MIYVVLTFLEKAETDVHFICSMSEMNFTFIWYFSMVNLVNVIYSGYLKFK